MIEFFIVDLYMFIVYWILGQGYECQEYFYCEMCLQDVDKVSIFMIIKLVNGVYMVIYEVVLVDYVGMSLNCMNLGWFEVDLVLCVDGVKVCKVGSFIMLWCIV